MCTSIFSDIILIQIFIIIVLSLLYYSTDIFYFIVNSVLFLALITSYVWFYDGDLFMNFLLIIDLGLYFLFFIFFLHYSNLFSGRFSTHSPLGRFVFLYGTIIVLVFILPDSFVCDSLRVSQDSVFFYNWYSVASLVFAADLQLLSELYFGFNLFEFILMNLYIYIVLLVVYYVISLHQVTTLRAFITSLNFVNYTSYSSSSVFIKLQDLEKQKSTSESVRVWGSYNQNSRG